MLHEILEKSKESLVICFNGVGSAFSKRNGQTSLIIAKNGLTILVDIGTYVPRQLAMNNISICDLDYFLITHQHFDHCGGVEEMLLTHRYIANKRPKFIITESQEDSLWEKTLRGGCSHSDSGALRFTDYAQPIRPLYMESQKREMVHFDIEGIDLLTFRTAHVPECVINGSIEPFWTIGLQVDGKVVFTGDSKYDPKIFSDLNMTNVKAIFHDCQLFNQSNNIGNRNAAHAAYDDLAILPESIREKIYLCHYGDNWDSLDEEGKRIFLPKERGFRGFTERWRIYQF